MASSRAIDQSDAMEDRHGARQFGAALALIAISTCALAGWAPLGFSIVAVFLFAGPHNWMEARYFLTRMPGRWGRLRLYFSTGIAGVILLSGWSLLLPSVARGWQWRQGDWLVGIAAWNSLLVLWLMLLAALRQREKAGRNWSWVYPGGFILIAAAWQWPMVWSLALVYVHPLVAMCFLDRELGRRRQTWQVVYRKCLALVPALLGLLWWRLADAPHLPGTDLLTLQISEHAGGSILAGVSTHLLVATHVFLEMLHYVVWIVLIPRIAFRAPPWSVVQVPLAQRSMGWKAAAASLLAFGGLVTVALWAGFLANYPLTRDIYFSLAIFHVLAEAPFLMRLL